MAALKSSSINYVFTPMGPRNQINTKMNTSIEYGEKSSYTTPHEFQEEERTCCNNPHIREEGGYMVCLNCGLVFDVTFDDSPRRAFTVEEVKNRKTNEPVYSKIGPRTVIRGGSDAKGGYLTPEEKSKFARLAKIQRSLTKSFDRNLWIALPNLKRFQEGLNLPEPVASDALRIYVRAVKARMTLGRSINALLAAAIYASLRIHNITRAFDEIVEIAESTKKNVLKGYHLIVTQILSQQHVKLHSFGPVQYIDKIAGEIRASMKVRNAAVELMTTAKKNGMKLGGKDPKGFAGASIYIVSLECGENKTQNEVAKCARVTEVTLRMRVKELKQFSILDVKPRN